MALIVLLVVWALVLTAKGCYNTEQVTCNENVSTLRALFVGNYSTNTTICVNLRHNSEETLQYTETPLIFSAVIVGNNSTVKCESSPVNFDVNSSYNYFPLLFSNASVVMITELHFDGCKRPLRFQWVQSLTISSSYFTNFDFGGALDISNTPVICIEDSVFINGTSMGLSKKIFSGNAGAVAIGYNDTGHLHDEKPQINISRCSFINNAARVSDNNFITVIEVLLKHVYNQRGGGMAFYFGENDYVGNITIEHCEFYNNTAEDSGGGIYMFLSGRNSFQTIVIFKTRFVGNDAQYGGGLETTHFNQDSLVTPNNISVIQCLFERNFGISGGGYNNIQLNHLANFNHLYVRDAVFHNNTADVGAGLYMQSAVTVTNVTLPKRIVVENCVVTNNTGRQGAMFINGNVVTIKGDNQFIGNTGPGLWILGTLVVFQENTLFRENRHHVDGFSGALHLSSFGQIVLYPQTTITFLGNIGREGASIVVRGLLIAATFTQQLYNPQCFLQYKDPTIPPPKWEVNMEFHGNRADIGPVVFLANATICLWNDSRSPFFDDELQNTWTFMNMSNNTVNNGEDLRNYYIQTGISRLNLADSELIQTAYPGEKIQVDVTAIDQFGQNTSAFVGIRSSEESSEIAFDPSIVPINSSNGVIKFQFMGLDNVTTSVDLTPFFIPEQTPTNFTLHHDTCLPGYKLKGNRRREMECVCNRIEGEVILCRGDFLLLANGLWGAPPSFSRELITSPCPPGYCHCTGIINDSDVNEGCQLLFSQPELICADSRQKENNTLCGRCKNNNGVGLLTNNCNIHDNLMEIYWLFPLYVVALVVSLVLLVKLGVHFPTILRGFLLYIQITPIALAYFPQIFRLNSRGMSCIASALALYIPYDFTFHEGMTSLESYALRYSAPLVALVVVPLAARIRHHRFKYWHGIWTIVLLMYVMAVEVSVSILHCSKLSSSTIDTTVWFFDGTVQCYKHWHIPLAILAIASLLALALIVVFVGAAVYYKTLRKKYEKFEQLERFSDVITRGIKHKYKWWPIVELGCRLIFVIFLVLTPSLVLPLVLAILIFVIQVSVHPYENPVANYMESFLFFWLVCLLGLGNTTTLQDETFTNKDPGWPNALLYFPVAVGLVVLVVNSFVLLLRKLSRHHKKMKAKELPTEPINLTQGSSTVTKTVFVLDD